MPVKVLIDSPQRNSSIYYKTLYKCLDPVIVIDIDGKIVGFFPSTEFEKAKEKSRCDEVFNLSSEFEILKKEKNEVLKSDIVLNYLKRNNIFEIEVDEIFPAMEAFYLQNNGIKINVKKEPFYPERVVKSQIEIEFIRENSIKNVKTMKMVKKILEDSTVNEKNQLVYKGEILTSEYVQTEILKYFFENGLISDGVIVAIGNQGCNPHEEGYGVIYANQSIVVDIFPKSLKNNYYTDMTRTFCKGKANDDLKMIYNTVRDAQRLAKEKVKAGVKGIDVYNFVVEYFKDKNFKTGVFDGVLQGFFHGVGHGVGIDCHEAPYIRNNPNDILLENSVVTVEPGLYYINKGAVRIEDLVIVNKDGCENLTEFDYQLEIE